jgi:hypothetical protein
VVSDHAKERLIRLQLRGHERDVLADQGRSMDMSAFLHAIPKVSLHLHLTGSVQATTAVELARKHAVPLPPFDEPEDLYDFRRFLMAGIDGCWVDESTKHYWKADYGAEFDALAVPLDLPAPVS